MGMGEQKDWRKTKALALRKEITRTSPYSNCSCKCSAQSSCGWDLCASSEGSMWCSFREGGVVGRSPTKPCTDTHSWTCILWTKSQALKYGRIPIPVAHKSSFSPTGAMDVLLDYTFHYAVTATGELQTQGQAGIQLLCALQGVSSFHGHKDGWTASWSGHKYPVVP